MPFHDDDADAQVHINARAAVLSQCDDELDDDDTNDENKSKVARGGEGELNASEKGLAGGANDDTVFNEDATAAEAADDDEPIEDVIVSFGGGGDLECFHDDQSKLDLPSEDTSVPRPTPTNNNNNVLPSRMLPTNPIWKNEPTSSSFVPLSFDGMVDTFVRRRDGLYLRRETVWMG